MKFIEDHRANALQRRVRLDHPGQDAFGNDLYPGGGRCSGLAANAIADRLPDFFAEGFGHSRRRRARGKAPGFEKHDASVC